MSMNESQKPRDLARLIDFEIADGFDEELEMELDDGRLAKLLDQLAEKAEPEGLDRHFYFKELFRLQRELVKLQDWVVTNKLKIVVVFEGRDAAGKGGVIKRITQRLNPRVCRVVALPAPTERERTQWYFQRYVAHLPAAGEMVLFDRSWYNRAGVERVMGFCTPDQVEEFFTTVPDWERMLVRSGIVLIKYWLSITDEVQHLRFQMRLHDPIKQEAEPDGPRIAEPLGRIHQGQGSDARAHAHSRGALVDRRSGGQEESASQLHQPSARPDSLCRGRTRPDRAAEADPARRLHSRSRAAEYACSGRLCGKHLTAGSLRPDQRNVVARLLSNRLPRRRLPRHCHTWNPEWYTG
jgi:polyphosphate kinase 2